MKGLNILMSALLVAGCNSASQVKWQEKEKKNNSVVLNTLRGNYILESIDGDSTPDVIKSTKTGEVNWVSPNYSGKFEGAKTMTPEMAHQAEVYFNSKNEINRLQTKKTNKHSVTYVEWAPADIVSLALRDYVNSRDGLEKEIELSLK